MADTVDFTNTPRPFTLQPSLLQFNVEFDRIALRVVNLADVHGESLRAPAYPHSWMCCPRSLAGLNQVLDAFDQEVTIERDQPAVVGACELG